MPFQYDNQNKRKDLELNRDLTGFPGYPSDKKYMDIVQDSQREQDHNRTVFEANTVQRGYDQKARAAAKKHGTTHAAANKEHDTIRKERGN